MVIPDNSPSEDHTSKLIHNYISKHSKHSILSYNNFADFCDNGKYIFANPTCGESIGNNMLMFLNLYALAIVTDRTLIYNNDDKKCDHVYTLNSWVLRLKDIEQYYRSHPDLFDTSSCRDMNTDNYDIDFNWFDGCSASPLLVGCCQVDLVNNRSFRIQRLDRLQVSALYHPGAVFGYKQTQDNVDKLFSNGILHGYGKLFHSVFTFSDEIKELNRDSLSKVMANKYNSFTVSIHLRHQSEGDDGKISDGDKNCVNSVVNSLRNKYDNNSTECNILLAADRMKSYLDFQIFTNEINCNVIASYNHNLARIDKSFNSSDSEHGPWGKDIISIFSDIYLLSHGDYFIGSSSKGTYASSFSALIDIIISGCLVMYYHIMF